MLIYLYHFNHYRYKDAQDVLEGILSILQVELTLRFNRHEELKDQATFAPRVRKAVIIIKVTGLY